MLKPSLCSENVHPGASKSPLQPPFARTEHDLSLPEPVKGTILVPKPRESGECRIKRHRSSMGGLVD